MPARALLRSLSLPILCGSLVLLGGCKGLVGSCHKAQAYSSAQSLPPLHIPVGLDGPDTRAAVRIPELNEPVAPRGKNDPCLEEPPRYDTAASTRPTR
ncbi:MAG TPA: hypothetical protein VLE45_03645 [Burkholderiaceae bacterium]|nr:hypothetical protein [Burkholderiaceae bacterium]